MCAFLPDSYSVPCCTTLSTHNHDQQVSELVPQTHDFNKHLERELQKLAIIDLLH